MRKSFFYIITAAAAFVLYSCGSGKDKSDYDIHESGLEYKMITENKDAKKVKQGDIVELDVKWYLEDNDSLMFDSREIGRAFKDMVRKPNYEGGTWDDALMLLHEGDSMVFRLNAIEFYNKKRGINAPKNFKETSKIRFHVKLLEIQSFQQIEEEQNLINNSNKEIEKKLLNDYLRKANINMEPTSEGMFFIPDKNHPGKGDFAKSGDSVTVHFVGYFVDGRPFANSYEKKSPFKYKLGDKSVIEGWNIGIQKMKKGSISTLIIPSDLAYGKDGDKTFNIPPFATLIFEIELIDLKK
ncbi:MAG: hypothetical protein A2W91_04710 [Bacteroidetes bacterium GWF2_38_335]|nr:MAG: hypothetical protein A2W91_04710 [Bacteroidetes bacterium GWF2_38_335]OFY80030.1 MAG: hypothetical protein A2281_12145 [Bacteroidetes bacterium RIFOXYA12_FULL_38_20]HBS85233.1 hypothetical protein [Bacteroidales bacterium]